MSKKSKALTLTQQLELINGNKTVEDGLFNFEAIESFENITGVSLENVDKVGEAISTFTACTGLAIGQYGESQKEDNPEFSIAAEISVGKHFVVSHQYNAQETVNDVINENVLRSGITIDLDIDGALSDVRNRIKNNDYK